MATTDDPEDQTVHERRHRRRSSQIPRSLRCIFSLCFPDSDDDIDSPSRQPAAQSRPFQPPIRFEHETRDSHSREPLRTTVQLNEAGIHDDNDDVHPSANQECTGSGKPSSTTMHDHNAGPSSLMIGHRDSAGDLTKQLTLRNNNSSVDPLGLLRQASSAHKDLSDPSTMRTNGKPPGGTSSHRRIGSSGLDRASSAEKLDEINQPASLSSLSALNKINQQQRGHRRNTSKTSVKVRTSQPAPRLPLAYPWPPFHQGSSIGSTKELGLARSPSPRLLVPQDEEDDFCPTCLEHYDEENPKIFTECGHHFHLPCLYEWANIKPTCPMCSLPMRW